MRIPVLAVLPSQEPLQESAAASIERRPPDISIESAELPARFELDPSFAAVPFGGGGIAEMTAEALAPARSESFVVRGFVEVADSASIPEQMDGRPLFADPVIAPFITCGGTPPLGNVPSVRQALNIPGMAARGLDGSDVAIAIVDTGINLAHLRAKLGAIPRLDAFNSWRPAGSMLAPGTHPVDHGTMCAFDALIAAPNATLIDLPVLAARAPGGSISGRTLSVAVQAFAHLIAFWGVAFASGGQYRGLVVNNSWGVFHPSWDFPAGHPGRYIDNPNHPFTALVGVLGRTGADILFAAGNCGSPCADGRCQGRTVGTIMGANASSDVLTIAGCDTNDDRVGYSSQGPSIARMPPQKPDVTCYTHFLGSEAFGAGSPDSGTSAACPVAAGCVAAIRTRVPPSRLPPANLFAQLTATARPGPGTAAGWNGDYGFGIVDPDGAARSLGV